MQDEDEPPGEAATLAEFLDLYLADSARGAPRTLPEYQALFTGFESAVATKHAQLTGQAPDDEAVRLGPFRLLREAGRGGQGSVHLAEDLRLGRRVALKVLRGFASMPVEVLARFRREASLASRLSHPGICPVFDFGLESGDAWIAMRWIEGESLAGRVGRRKASGQAPDAADLRQMVPLFEGAARALHAAHEAGIIHRDLKPANLMLEGEAVSADALATDFVRAGERIVIVDFGLAHEAQDDPAVVTHTGDVVGTPAYLAPEQLAPGGGRAGPLADVYSLGVSLYEALTLRRPFEAPTREKLFRAIEAGLPPDPRSLNPAITGELRAVILTAMDADPARRYRSASELADDLQRVRERKPVHARPAGPLKRFARFAQRNPALAASTLIALLGLATGLVIALLALADTARERDRKQEALRGYEQLSDALLIQELLADGETLWPRHPERIPSMEAWLARARDVAGRRARHARARDAVRRAAPAAAEDRWRASVLEAMLRDLERLDRAIEEIAARIDRTERNARESVVEGGAAWAECARRLAASSAFAGLELRPEPGLLPLGCDEDSGLFEFWHVDSGARPAWKGSFESGSVRVGEDSGIVLVLLPGAAFTMGAQSGNPRAPAFDGSARSDEAPARVSLEPFFIAKHEMTQAQWIRIAGSNPSVLSPARSTPASPLSLLHPVENVDRESCVAILRRLGLELPTEARWEYACRAGTATPWWTGDDAESLRGAANLADAAFARLRAGAAGEPCETWLDDGYPHHAPIGRFAANPFGLHDVHGNVLEWCRDGFDRDPGPPRAGDGLRTEPSLTDIGIARGGSFFNDAGVARSAARFAPRAANSALYLGVRPARSLRAK